MLPLAMPFYIESFNIEVLSMGHSWGTSSAGLQRYAMKVRTAIGWRVYTLLLAALALARPLVEVEDTPRPTLITNVRILTSSGEVEGPYDVLLRDGRIAEVREVSDGADTGMERVVNGTGATLMPGLVDTHVHVGSFTAIPGRLHLPHVPENLAAWLYAGVTTVLDLGMPRSQLERIQRRIDAGRLDGPDVFGTGKPFGAPGGHPKSALRAAFKGPLVRIATAHMAWEVETDDEVDRAFAKQGTTGFAKVLIDQIPNDVPILSDGALARIRTDASASGARVVTHVGRPEDVERALAMPTDALAHTVYTGRLTEAQITRLAEEHIPVIPTLVVWESTAGVATAHPLLDPMEREILPRRSIRDLEANFSGRAPMQGALARWAEQVVTGKQQRWDNVRAMVEAGVPILVGSDSPNLGLTAGASLHREMDNLAEAGMSPAEVLVAATWENSRFIDPDAEFGAIEPGWEADLLLVDGDPTRDLRAVHDLRAVWVDGREVTRRGR